MHYCRTLLDLPRWPTTSAARRTRAAPAPSTPRWPTDQRTHAWDGEWYARSSTRRAADRRRRRGGCTASTSTRRPGRCTGSGPAERPTAMRSVHERPQAYGVALLWPPYECSDTRIAGTSTYPPGARRTAASLHANTWVIIAAGHARRPDQVRVLRQILPLARPTPTGSGWSRTCTARTSAPRHPQFGMGRNAWLTGPLRGRTSRRRRDPRDPPTHAGLRVAPAIPTRWPGYTATRRFRGTTYEIAVTRGAEPTFTVDGRPCDGDVVPLPPAGTERVRVAVTLASQVGPTPA